MTDGPRFLSLGWTQASISPSPCLRRTRTPPSLWYKENRDSVRSRLRMVRTDSRLPTRRIICIRRRGAEMKRFVLTIRGSWRSSRGGVIFIEPPRFLWVVGQSIGCVAKFCLCILETPPASWLLLAENCHLPTTWKFTAVFAVANSVVLSPLKVQRNINSLYRNPTLHKSIKVVIAWQTSLQVTTPELTIFLLLTLRGPQTMLCLAIQFVYVMDPWNQQYFVPNWT